METRGASSSERPGGGSTFHAAKGRAPRLLASASAISSARLGAPASSRRRRVSSAFSALRVSVSRRCPPSSRAPPCSQLPLGREPKSVA